jgi:hypothetical protein
MELSCTEIPWTTSPHDLPAADGVPFGMGPAWNPLAAAMSSGTCGQNCHSLIFSACAPSFCHSPWPPYQTQSSKRLLRLETGGPCFSRGPLLGPMSTMTAMSPSVIQTAETIHSFSALGGLANILTTTAGSVRREPARSITRQISRATSWRLSGHQLPGEHYAPSRAFPL